MTKSRGINRKRTSWAPDMDAELTRRYPDEQAAVIARDMGLPVYAIYNRAHFRKLKKSETFYSDPKMSGRTDGQLGKSARIQKGNIPWNKGKTGLNMGQSATRFKPGQKPHNTRQIGDVKLNKDGMLMRKISHATGNNSARWRAVHELVWTEANGPLPPGHIVVFKPGMQTNVLEEITLDKVECISLEENMRRNTRHRLPPELNEIIHMRAVLSRQINKRSKA